MRDVIPRVPSRLVRPGTATAARGAPGGPRSRSLLSVLFTALLIASALGAPSPVRAQGGGAGPCTEVAWLTSPDLGSGTAELARLAEISGLAPPASWLLRRASDEIRVGVCDTAAVPWRAQLHSDPGAAAGELRVSARPVRLFGEMNSAYPIDRNNGGLWAGRGVSAGLSAGVSLELGPLTVAVEPLVAYQQNRPFEIARATLPGYVGAIYHGHLAEIDWPQRFGNSSYWTVYPGQSHVRLDVAGFAGGVSTENLWWGPAQRHPLVLSNTGPGFLHGFLRTARPFELWGAGELEAELVWGRLRESHYFDADASNDTRSAAGAIVSWAPPWVSGLRVGGARMRITAVPPDGPGALHYLGEPFRSGATPEGTGALEMASVFARWVFPASRLEVYGELSVPELGGGGAVAEDEAGRGTGYVVGATKGLALSDGWLRLYAELMGLENYISLEEDLPTGTFYVHPDVEQGYTHLGQLLGAAAGPGSEAQVIGADLYRRWGSLGVSVERVAYDDDAYYSQYAARYGMHGHDVEVAAAVRQTLLFGDLRGSWSLRFASRRNRDFIPLAEGYWSERNTTLGLGLSWTPRLSLSRPLPPLPSTPWTGRAREADDR